MANVLKSILVFWKLDLQCRKFMCHKPFYTQ